MHSWIAWSTKSAGYWGGMPAISVIESHCIGCRVSIRTGAQISLRLALMNSARSGNRWRVCWRFTTSSDHSQRPNRPLPRLCSPPRSRRLYGSQNRPAALVDSAISCQADHPGVRKKKCRSRSKPLIQGEARSLPRGGGDTGGHSANVDFSYPYPTVGSKESTRVVYLRPREKLADGAVGRSSPHQCANSGVT